MKLLTGLLFATIAVAQMWTPQVSGTEASLRGVSVVNPKVVWASGADGTWLRTLDGGAKWRAAKVPGAETMDFRGVRAITADVAYLMSSGPGDKSRIYKTLDAGTHWTLQFTNPDAKGFLDAMAFWDASQGIVVGDPVDGHFAVFTTQDAGAHWLRQPAPEAAPDEGAFAASNSCLFIRSKSHAWFATGGPGGARVLQSNDRGRTWAVAVTPMRNDVTTAGIFSLAFSSPRNGIAVGGDYSHDGDARRNIAFTSDGGRAWTAAAAGPKGFRSAVLYLADRKMWVVTGTSGSEYSIDGGHTWKYFDPGAYNALGGTSGNAVWGVGPKGRIAKLELHR